MLLFVLQLCACLPMCFGQNDTVEHNEPKLSKHFLVSTGNFSLEILYAATQRQGEVNLVTSPFSVCILLAAILEGANGNTRQQLLVALRLPSYSSRETARWFYQEISKRLAMDTTAAQFTKYNGIFVNWFTGFNVIEHNFRQISQQYYETDAVDLNFKNSAAAATINRAVYLTTEGWIPAIIDENQLNDTNMIITSAVYFKGECDDCVVFNFCHDAVTLLRKRNPTADAQLRNAFCGFHYNKLPMICCSELTTETPDPVENHANLYLLPNSCTKSKKISGGRPARRYEFPWMVLLAYETPLGPQFKCSGSLITERYVLTAAHCISEKLIGVRVGDFDMDSTAACNEQQNCRDMIQDLYIEEAIPHSKYSGRPKVRNDIGVLRLRNCVNLASKNTGVICLPVTKQQRYRDLGRQVGTVAGWGFTEQGFKPPVLRTVAVPIYSAESCRQLYNRGRKSGEEDETLNKLCAGQRGLGSCDGDSGGPLVVEEPGNQFIQYGVDSYGPTLCGADFPSAYTDVTKYMKWILDALRP